MKRALAVAAVLAAMLTSSAAEAPLGPDDIQAGTYTIDTKETLVRYSTIHMGINAFWGTFPGATGTLTIDPKAVGDAKLDVTVPVATVETTNRELNGEFFSDEFFDAEKYRTMHFVSSGVVRTGPATAKVTGNLTIHGVTREVVLNVTFTGAGPNFFNKVATIGFKGEAVVKRSDFGLGKFVPIVSDETTIDISAAFEKK
ncbi:MAG TPA: YceI family protein [Rhizomicrobium sp.]|nr:YceI family protein [Rhizomicrobium sp.]